MTGALSSADTPLSAARSYVPLEQTLLGRTEAETRAQEPLEAARRLVPRLSELRRAMDRTATIPRSLLDELHRAGMLRLTVPVELGGYGLWEGPAFVPFFQVQAATITGLSRLAKLAGAVVVPAVTRQLPGAGGYVLTFYPAWTDFPGASVEEDTRRMNAFIEQRVLEMPEQYFWLHKRFKTRPPGEPRFY